MVGAPTKEYAQAHSMMHRRLTTAGIEVAPHYHQLLVDSKRRTSNCSKFDLLNSRKSPASIDERNRHTHILYRSPSGKRAASIIVLLVVFVAYGYCISCTLVLLYAYK